MQNQTTPAQQPDLDEMTLDQLDAVAGGISFKINTPQVKVKQTVFSLPQSYFPGDLFFPGEML